MKSVKRIHDHGKEGRLIIDVAIERLTKTGRRNGRWRQLQTNVQSEDTKQNCRPKIQSVDENKRKLQTHVSGVVETKSCRHVPGVEIHKNRGQRRRETSSDYP